MEIKTPAEIPTTTVVSLSTETPLWLDTLRQKAEQQGLKAVAKDIGYSTAVVSQVVNGKYKGDLSAVETKVRGAYLGDTVRCPVLDELAVNLCLEHQAKPYRSTNRQAVMLYRACRTCPNRRDKEVS